MHIKHERERNMRGLSRYTALRELYRIAAEHIYEPYIKPRLEPVFNRVEDQLRQRVAIKAGLENDASWNDIGAKIGTKLPWSRYHS